MECIQIRMLQGKGALILNKKEEYSRSILPQLEVSIGGKVLASKLDGTLRDGIVGRTKKEEDLREDKDEKKREHEEERDNNPRVMKKIKIKEDFTEAEGTSR